MSLPMQGHTDRSFHLLVDPTRAAAMKQEATQLRSITLSDPGMRDIELILGGACAPLRGYMGRADYESVLQHQRLADGTFFPVPITLDLEAAVASTLRQGERLVLRDDEGAMLAILTVEDVWAPDRQRERALLKPPAATDRSADTLETSEELHAVGGHLEGVSLPIHHDYPHARVSATRLKAEQTASGLKGSILVDPDSAPSRAHQRGIRALARELEARVVLHPTLGALRATELELHRRMKHYRSLLSHHPAGSARLALLPLAPRASGPREWLWRALVHRNCGVTHWLLDPRLGMADEDAAGPDAFNALASACRAHLGLELISLLDLRTPAEDPANAEPGAGAFESDAEGDWETGRHGVTCFFTGLSGAGKSTIARALAAQLSKLGRTVTLLDGDLIRRHLSSELNFSKEHRDLNIRRIGYVASEITRHGGIAICAPIAPYRVTRAAVRSMIEAQGGFLEIHVSTPLAVCEQRDPKGLYAKAHAGLIKDFTGINDPYEAPEHPEIAIDTSRTSVESAVALIMTTLRDHGYLDTLPGESDAMAGEPRNPRLRMVARKGGGGDVG